MRYVAPTFHEATLRRGNSLEQFLGGIVILDELHVAWVELRPVSSGIEVWRFVAPDLGDEDMVDFYEFCDLEDRVMLGVFETPSLAIIQFASSALGASTERWANQFVIQDDYRDYVREGRRHMWSAPAI